MIKSEEILNQLDKNTKEYNFPMLDNGYVYLAGTKMSLYRDSLRWALIIEVVGFNYRGGGHNGISNCIHIYGNCLLLNEGMNNENFINLTDNYNHCNTFDEEEEFYLNPNCDSFLLRGNVTKLIHDRSIYNSNGIILEDENKINAFEFLRLLSVNEFEKLIATEIEIRKNIPTDLPKIMELEDWFHPDLADNELPSNNETFIQISKVLETGNLNLYKPTKEPNTHWKNWPDGGTL